MAINNKQQPQTRPLSEIPNKIFYSISEASDYTGVEPHVLRYWETKFSKLNPKRVSGNQRKYTRGDLELLYEIVRLLYHEGYTLDGAEKKLRSGMQTLRAERQMEEEKSETIHASESHEPPKPESPASPALLEEIKQELAGILDLLK